MSFFKEKSDQEIDLVLDVGNGSVAAGLVLLKEGGAPAIIYSKRLPIALSEEVEPKKLSAFVLHILQEILSVVAKDGVAHMHELGHKNEKVKHTFCVLSSPWYVSKTKILKIENTDPIFISRSFVDSLLKKEETIFKEEMGKKDLEIIEKKIIQTKLNGYNTSDPYHKKARHIELAIFLSLGSKEMIDAIGRIVGKFFYSKNMVLHSFSFVEHNVVNDIFSNESDFVFLDISSEVTDVSSVEKNVLMETMSFPFGRSFLVKKVAQEFGVTPEIALSFINMRSNDHAERESAEKIERAYGRAKQEWADQFFRTISDIVKGRLPSKIFVTVDDDVAPFFVSCIKESLSMAQKTMTDFATIPVVLLDEEKLSQFVEFGAGANRDPFLGLEAIFLHKLWTGGGV